MVHLLLIRQLPVIALAFHMMLRPKVPLARNYMVQLLRSGRLQADVRHPIHHYIMKSSFNTNAC